LPPDKVPPQLYRDFVRLWLFCFGNSPDAKQKEASQGRQELCIPQLDAEVHSVGMIEVVRLPPTNRKHCFLEVCSLTQQSLECQTVCLKIVDFRKYFKRNSMDMPKTLCTASDVPAFSSRLTSRLNSLHFIDIVSRNVTDRFHHPENGRKTNQRLDLAKR
jgi:hypothetical protein